MIDHLTVSVTDFPGSKAFYARVLAPLGYTLKRDYPNVCGFGDTRPYFWIKQAETGTTPQHLAFAAKDRAAVDGFHRAALEAGAKDDGAPGLREHYHPNYYGAFVIDPLNGHPIEAVCHLAPGGVKAAAPRKAAKKAAKKPARGPAKKAKARRR